MANVTIRQLEVFVHAAETLSFVRVAELLSLTPSAVSFQVRQLEQQTGVALFERIGRRVALTEAGTVLLAYGRPVLQSMRDMEQAMTSLQGVDTGRISLGLVSTAKYIVPHMIARFRNECPGIVVTLREGNRTRILSQLLAGTIDLAVMGQPPDGADVIADFIAAHPSVVIAHAAHPLRARPRIEPRALEPEWFVVREQGSGTRGLSDRFFQSAGFAPRIAMETSSNEMIKQAVIAGMGLAVISQHTVGLEVSLGLLATLPVEGFPIMRSWFVAHRRTAPLLPAQLRLRSFLVESGGAIVDAPHRGYVATGVPGAAPGKRVKAAR